MESSSVIYLTTVAHLLLRTEKGLSGENQFSYWLLIGNWRNPWLAPSQHTQIQSFKSTLAKLFCIWLDLLWPWSSFWCISSQIYNFDKSKIELVKIINSKVGQSLEVLCFSSLKGSSELGIKMALVLSKKSFLLRNTALYRPTQEL